MTECEVCGVGTPAGKKRCSHCGYHILAPDLLSDPGLGPIRTDLGKALQWQFYRHRPRQLHNIAEAKEVIDWFHARDPEELQALAVAAVAGPKENPWPPVKDPWSTEVLHRVSTSIGVSEIEARVFIEDLRARGGFKSNVAILAGRCLGLNRFQRSFAGWSATPKSRRSDTGFLVATVVATPFV